MDGVFCVMLIYRADRRPYSLVHSENKFVVAIATRLFLETTCSRVEYLCDDNFLQDVRFIFRIARALLTLNRIL